MTRRRGSWMLELIGALALVATLMGLGAQVLTGARSAQRAAARKILALEEAANCLERLANVPWEELTAGRLTGQSLDAEVARQLPHADLRVEVGAASGDPPGKPVRVTIAWSNGPSQGASVSLVGWRFRVPQASLQPGRPIP